MRRRRAASPFERRAAVGSHDRGSPGLQRIFFFLKISNAALVQPRPLCYHGKMSVEATGYSVCDICGQRHARDSAHVWPKDRGEAGPDDGKSEGAATAIRGRLRRSRTLGVGGRNKARGGDLIAPPGECAYCDRRRAYNTEKMRRAREKDAGNG